MKKITIILSCIFIFSSCSTSEIPVDNRNVIYLWHLVRVTGGFADVDAAFGLDTIVWTFSDESKTLVIKNNNEDDTVEDALDSGTYNFEVLEINDKTYLNINNSEFGSFLISQNTLTIDQNITSIGSGADGFVYTFQRTITFID